MIRSGNKTTSTSTSSMSSFNIQQRVLPSSSYYSFLLFFQYRSSTWLGLGSILLLIAFSALFLYNNNINNSPFDQPFCDPDGTCHEAPDQGTPRTVYSTWNKEQFDGWWKFYEVLNEHAEVYANKRQAMYERGNTTALRSRPLILLGDSITESWSGTGMGIPKQRAAGSHVLKEELSGSAGLDPIVLAISGDQTQHLLYRLQHGHMRAAQLLRKNKNDMVYDPDAIFVVMIGTNNLGAGELPGPTTLGILAVVRYILEQTVNAGCHVIIFEVLPRGDGKTWSHLSSNESFLPTIRTVNEGLRDGVHQLNDRYAGSRIQLIDCGTAFLNPNHYDNGDGDDSSEVKKTLMPDLLHPNQEGHKVLAKCIRTYTDHIDQ